MAAFHLEQLRHGLAMGCFTAQQAAAARKRLTSSENEAGVIPSDDEVRGGNENPVWHVWES